ncbi:1-(5-phosphoribosyl)-5-[(5-phosphoribosylamino)methylideneamino]imidazole-4-carboxamide isomerase [Fructilactobacillus frigidiflavus]|uniref:1-(5-phosphoribosyl)-5-[(5- phosphoribosylamino)methylideneamino]imidazole-4- carboxamide isomerase n=1 Tax=Fructilactobacillus frigidiflavus TaxID=3242688 RepID=UPI003756A0F4
MLLPAIDLIDGQSVRLQKGDFAKKTIIQSDPQKQVQAIQAAGLTALHLIDLNGAQRGAPLNQAVIQSIRQNFTGFIEVGGGIRTQEQVEKYFAMGIDRVILGSVALSNPQLVADLARQYGQQIVIAIEGKAGKIAVNGWQSQSEISFSQLMKAMIELGIANFIVTDVNCDGMLMGPNLTLLRDLRNQFPNVNLIASGGITSPTDLAKIQALGIQDIVIGKALATGQITLSDLKELRR